MPGLAAQMDVVFGAKRRFAPVCFDSGGQAVDVAREKRGHTDVLQTK